MAIKDSLAKLPKWQKVFVVVGIIIAIGLIWFFALYKPTQEKITNLEAQIRRIKSDIQEQERAKHTKRTLQAQIIDLKRELTFLRSKLPEEKEIPALLSTVTEVGRLNGLDFVLFKQERAVRKDYYSEIPVEIKVTGGFHQVVHFLAKVGTLDRILHVSELKMGQYKPSNGSGHLETSMQATTYKYESQTLPKPETQKRGKAQRKR
jgi:type IV pilus assembly protein PilO